MIGPALPDPRVVRMAKTREAARKTEAGMGRIILWGVAGLIAGPIVTLALATAAIPIFGISQMEGAYAMGVVFTLMPIGAVIGLAAGLTLAILRRR